ncbi:hypothetical protein ACFFRR_010700 [Megaselia abdita]
MSQRSTEVQIFKIITLFTLVVFWSGSLGSTFELNRDDPRVPCSFFDTVNLTDHVRYENGSYQYEDIIIPKEYTGTYNYEFRTLSDKVKVQPHVRGCICLLKKCIKMCCGRDTMRYMNKSCEDIYPGNKTIEVTYFDGSIVKDVVIGDIFAVQEGRPCESMYGLEPPLDNFTIFENGTLLREFDSVYINKDSYCLASIETNDLPNRTLLPLVCFPDQSKDAKIIVYSYAMIFSVPFMLLTSAVYLIIPELRNIHGKSLVCYLIGLSFGYTILAFFKMAGTLNNTFCQVTGFLAYFLFMSSFFWLSVISFDLWWNFKGMIGMNRFNERKRFAIYSLYAWGFACLFLMATITAQLTSFINPDWKPHIGSDEFCWLNVKTGWSALLYFFGPIMIIISVNVVLFILTSLKIHSVQREMAKITAKDDSRKNLNNEKDRFGLFLRLFIVMGVTWMMEIISYMVGDQSQYAKLFYLSDICNAVQGFIIFALFVLKKKVKDLMTKRFSKRLNSIGSVSTVQDVCLH